MTKTLTSAIALELVERIEALQRDIESVYAEARAYDGEHNDNVIRDAVAERRAMREAASNAEGLIGSFDWTEDGATA